MEELLIMEEFKNKLNELETCFTLVCLSSELNLINSRLIDVLLLNEEQRKEYKTKINELLEEKKILQKTIISFRQTNNIK